MMQFLKSIEDTRFCIWVREANTVFAYPSVLALHTFGLIFLVGLSSAISLRMLGVARDLPVTPMRKFFPFIWAGLWVNLASGLVLLALDARAFLTNVDFYIKMISIVVAVRSLKLLQATAFGPSVNLGAGPVPAKARILGRTILFAWAVAITAGRLTAYDPFIQRQTAVAVVIFAVVMLVGRRVVARLLGWDKSAPAAHAVTAA